MIGQNSSSDSQNNLTMVVALSCLPEAEEKCLLLKKQKTELWRFMLNLILKPTPSCGPASIIPENIMQAAKRGKQLIVPTSCDNYEV